jgi:succinate dehydrogenase/fumarate reductase flavoprotein subunit
MTSLAYRFQVRGTPFNVGDGFKLARMVHAQETGERGGCHSTCWDAHAPDDAGDRNLTNQFTKSGYPLGIMVNSQGKRFVDEGEDYRNYTYAKFGRLINEQPEGVAWQIWDSKVMPLLRVEEYADDVVRRLQASSLEELIGILAKDGVQDPEQLKKTIVDFNNGVSSHRAKSHGLKFDPAVKDNLSTEGITPPKTNWAQTLDKPPYLAVKVACGITFTFYGLKIDPKTAAVVDKEQRPIPGLFCAGEMVGGQGGTALFGG